MTARDELRKLDENAELLRAISKCFAGPDGLRVLDFLLDGMGFDWGLPVQLTAEQRGMQDAARWLFTQVYRADPTIAARLTEQWAKRYRMSQEQERSRIETSLQEEQDNE